MDRIKGGFRATAVPTGSLLVVADGGFVVGSTENVELLDVWMDGDCPVCQVSRKWCSARDPEGRIRFIDFRTSKETDLPCGRDQHEASMWVRDRDGALLEGFAAWRRIMETIPGWGWLARLAGAPPLRWVGPSLYRLVARFRFRITRP